MTKEQSTIVKGIAILMMIFLHLFSKGNLADICTPLLYLGDRPWVTILTRMCNPVSLFIILSGYGLHYLYTQNKLNFTGQIRRLIKLYIYYWLTLIVFVPIGSIVNPQQYPGDFLKIIGNITSYTNTYNYETWFLFPYMLTSLTALWIFKIQSRIGNLAALFFSVLLYGVAGYAVSYGIAHDINYHSILSHFLVYLEFIFPIVIGGWLHSLSKHRGLAIPGITPIMSILLMLILFASRMTFSTGALNPLYAVVFILLLMQVHDVPKYFKDIFLFLGKYSMPMWLTHTYFSNYIFPDFIFGFKYPVVIFVVLVLISLVTAYLLTLIANRVIKTIRL